MKILLKLFLFLPLVSMGVGAAKLGISGCGGCTLGPGQVVVPPEQYRGLVAWQPSATSRRVDASAEYSGIMRDRLDLCQGRNTFDFFLDNPKVYVY